jgi:hypothetical protein
MLGWDIFIKDQAGNKLASWMAGLGGTDWIEELAEQGLAERVMCGGYPTSFKLEAKHMLSFLRAKQLPDYKGTLVVGDDYVRGSGLNIDAIFNDQAINLCQDNDFLFVVAWDQS